MCVFWSTCNGHAFCSWKICVEHSTMNIVAGISNISCFVRWLVISLLKRREEEKENEEANYELPLFGIDLKFTNCSIKRYSKFDICIKYILFTFKDVLLTLCPTKHLCILVPALFWHLIYINFLPSGKNYAFFYAIFEKNWC